MKSKIRKILVANRGEIALRITRTCEEMGIKSVAIYSNADAHAPFVSLATEAYPLNGVTAGETYLDQKKIVTIAAQAGADAIHPGYGFLSENDDFAELIGKAGVVFIGPSPGAIRNLGDKTSARRLAESIGIPIVPGTHETITDLEHATRLARASYPILLKAAGGGGGKGMRVVHTERDLESALRTAKSEAQSAFGDDRVYIERYIKGPRHIEVQILADSHGRCIHLGERECSIQRRYQKVIEESPSPAIDATQRSAMTDAAIQLCRHGGYENAGTVEFLLDEKGRFFFLEVNTRLQVEHPITEVRTGIDIVREQISIAEGNPLAVKQEDIEFTGCSMECRVYAEDPENGFLPSTGSIVHLKSPSGFSVREERGVEVGDEILPYFDPMIAKLITWGSNRHETIDRMIRALKEYEIFGVKNNISLCLWVLHQPDYREGRFDTTFLEREFKPDKITPAPDSLLRAMAVLAVENLARSDSVHATRKNGDVRRTGWTIRRNEGMR